MNSSRIFHRLRIPAVALGLIALGGGTVAYLWLTAPALSQVEKLERGLLVRTIVVQPTSHRIAVTAYGTAQAAAEWVPVAEVRGRVRKVHPQFASGAFVPAGEVVLEIDPAEYEIAARRAGALLRTRQEELRELRQKENNLKVVLRLKQKQLRLAKDDFARHQALYQTNTVTQGALDAVERQLLTVETAVQDLANQIAVLPIQIERLRSVMAQAQADLDDARRMLKNTKITVPFPARCSERSIEKGQFVLPGQTLGRFLSIDEAEVVVQLDAYKAGLLWPRRGLAGQPSEPHADRVVRKHSGFNTSEIVAKARPSDSPEATMSGTVVSIGSSLHPASGTLPVTIRVARSLQSVGAGGLASAPLTPNTHCQVTLYGPTLHNVIVIPRDCVQNGRVFLVKDGKLRIAPVQVAARHGKVAVIISGIEAGDHVVSGDLFPAVEGMPLRVEESPSRVNAAGTLLARRGAAG